jgi:hypothetical protein
LKLPPPPCAVLLGISNKKGIISHQYVRGILWPSLELMAGKVGNEC